MPINTAQKRKHAASMMPALPVTVVPGLSTGVVRRAAVAWGYYLSPVSINAIAGIDADYRIDGVPPEYAIEGQHLGYRFGYPNERLQAHWKLS